MPIFGSRSEGRRGAQGLALREEKEIDNCEENCFLEIGFFIESLLSRRAPPRITLVISQILVVYINNL